MLKLDFRILGFFVRKELCCFWVIFKIWQNFQIMAKLIELEHFKKKVSKSFHDFFVEKEKTLVLKLIDNYNKYSREIITFIYF